jgi:hypothetical protein
MRSLKALVLLGALPLTACLSIYDVRKGVEVKPGTKKVAGVPFYTRSAECRHKTVWLEPVYTLSLQLQRAPESAGKPEPPAEEIAAMSLGLTAYSQIKQDRERLPALMRDISTGTLTDAAKAQERFQDLTKNLPPPLRGAQNDFILAANTRTVESAVDYTKPYTYNVRRPWAGTASSTLKLNTDGTLGEATASVEDKTIETLASVLPIKDFLTAKFIPKAQAGSPAAPAGSGTAPTLRFVLTVRTTVFRHTLSKAEGPASGPSCAPPDVNLGPAPAAGLDYLLEELKDSAPPKAEGKGKTIELSGQIVLPEETKPNP